MDSILFSKNPKQKNFPLLTLNRWQQTKKQFIAFALLFTAHEVVSEVMQTTDPFFPILKPILMAVFFMIFFFVRNYTLHNKDSNFLSQKKVLVIAINDIVHFLGLTIILITDGVDAFRNGNKTQVFFHSTKFWVFSMFSVNAFFLLTSKVFFFIVVFIFQGVNIILAREEEDWRTILQTLVVAFMTILLVFMIDNDRYSLTSSYIDIQSQERTWRYVLEFLQEGVTIIDKNGECVYGNKCFNRILGYETQFSEFENSMDLSRIKNLRFPHGSKNTFVNNKNNSSSPIITEGYLYEDRLLNINLERANTLKDLLDFLRSKWINTVDLLRKLSNENGGCLHLEGEIDEHGTKTYVEARITILSYEDKNNLLVTLYGATSKNAGAPAKEIEKFRDKMIGKVFYQLLNPLHGSINFVTGAIEDLLTPPTVKDIFLSPALNSMNFLTNTISDLIDLFNLSSNSLRMKYSSHSLLDTIKEALSLIDDQAGKKGLTIIKIFKISPKLVCYTDHKRLVQILLNILSVAIKYTFKGSVAISVEKTSYKDFSIKIEDTGIGLSDEEKRKLLNEKGKIRYLSFDSPDYFGENDIGLMISNELAKKLGPVSSPDSCGIFFESEQEKGSCYHFAIEDKSYSQKSQSGDHYKINIIEDSKLRSYDFESEESTGAIPSSDYNLTPKFLPEDAHKARVFKPAKLGLSKKSVSVTRRANSSKRLGQCNCPEVLIIDDDVFSVSSLEQIMNICRFSTASCFNGLEGIREIMRRKDKKCNKKCGFLKLIFVEMHMPLMGGEEFIANIKDLMDKNEIPHTPIVACTKTQEGNNFKKAREAGAVECIVKPISKESILDILQKLDIR